MSFKEIKKKEVRTLLRRVWVETQLFLNWQQFVCKIVLKVVECYIFQCKIEIKQCL